MKVIDTEKLPIKMWLEDIEDSALDQAKNLANLPFAYKWIALMPDSHSGYGMPIGGVMATHDVIIPNCVGVDIGCGMIAVKTSLQGIGVDTIKLVMGDVRKEIPVGFTHQKEVQEWEGFNRAPNIQIIQQQLESRLTDEEWKVYVSNLYVSCAHGKDVSILTNKYRWVINATAQQKCDAFVEVKARGG